ncbi:NUDIX hydrolase [uncultured Limosilactobacillus sp.]|uniref:NUDIX hydrolase n=1 Tax=uncultured Limosilactobacillus sp. TaxID=2837629 RepID=UPI0025DB6323|nr:NUDIX hydrolase [uncultured Limosilactobacillus sp.]
MSTKFYDQLIDWAIKLQSLAQDGLAYCNDKYDRQRYQELRTVAAEMMAAKSGQSLSQVQELFCNERGYQTPKIDTRAAIFREGKILLVKQDGQWSLPGGWAEVNISVAENCVKETREETGLHTVVQRVIALQEYNRHNCPPLSPYGICKIFFLSRVTGGQFEKNIETQGYDYFALDELPPLITRKSNEDQIRLCFAAAHDPHWQTRFE